jgi:hypothetical protein
VAPTYICSGKPTANPIERGGRGQAHQTGQFDVRAVRVRLQLGEQLKVNFIKFNRHGTKHYLVLAPDG